MRSSTPLSSLFLSVLMASAATAGTVDINFFAELDGTFSGGNAPLPGRSSMIHDAAGSAFTDLGINAFSDPNTGSITTIARIDIGNPDTNLLGIGIGRVLFTGMADTGFGGGDGHVEFSNLGITNVVDACQDVSGRYVVAAAVPGANGSGGAKDMAIVRFTSAGAIDTAYSSDGVASFTLTDNATDFDEALLDIECLPNGNYLVGGFANQGNGQRIGILALLPSSGNVDLPNATLAFGLSSGDQESQVTAVHFNETRDAYVVALSVIGTTNTSRAALLHYELVNGTSFVASLPSGIQLGSDHCQSYVAPTIAGIARISANDYAVSFHYSDANLRRAAVGRMNVGENILVSCTQAPFAVTNAAITPPLVYQGRVFVGLGIAPLNGAPVQSQVRAYLPNQSGLSLLVESDFGSNGLTQWQHAFNGNNANNARSFIQRLYVDPAGLLMAIGTRVWSGNDTDVALARLGSSGIFDDSFEGDQ